MRLFFAMFMSYLVGSIPTGHLFAKYKNVDLKKVGSGSTGATNVYRALGKTAAILTLLIDMFKGFLVVTFFADSLYNYRMNLGYSEYLTVLGLCVVVGHNWPILLDFKGGKGIATSAGVLLGICPKLFIVGLCFWILIFVVTRIVSLSSLISSIMIPLSSYFFNYEGPVKALTFALAILTIVRHRANVKRLIKREENRLVKRFPP